MEIHIPPSLINGFWASIGTSVAGIALIIIGVRSGKIPLWWGNRMEMTTDSLKEYLTSKEFDSKLRMHCVSQHADFKSANMELKRDLESIFSAQNRILDKIDTMRDTQTEILQRVSKMEGRLDTSYAADHK